MSEPTCARCGAAVPLAPDGTCWPCAVAYRDEIIEEERAARADTSDPEGLRAALPFLSNGTPDSHAVPMTVGQLRAALARSTPAVPASEDEGGRTVSEPTDSPLGSGNLEYNRGWAAGNASALDACNPIIERLQRALRVANHSPHDQSGEPVEGFPVCSVCGAIQTAAARADTRRTSDPEGLDVERLAEKIRDHYATGRHGMSDHACAVAIAMEYAALSDTTGTPEP